MPSFFVPTPGDLTAQESPPPGICHPRQKNANARGLARRVGGGEGLGWAQLELTDALVHGFSQKIEIFPSFGFIENSLRKSVV